MHLILNVLHNSKIDRDRWDKCVNKSLNCKIFGYSWFLDNVFYDWFGIVDENYRAVLPMPLINKNTIGRVAFMHELSIYGIKLNVDIINQFLTSIPKEFKIKKLPLNIPLSKLNMFYSFNKTHYYSKDILSCDKNYFNKKSVKGEYFSSTISIMQFDTFLKNNSIKLFKQKDIQVLKRLIRFSINYKFGYLKGVFSENNSLVGTYFYIKFKSRIYLLMLQIDKNHSILPIFQHIENEMSGNINCILDFYAYCDDVMYKWLKENQYVKKTIINISNPNFVQKLFYPYNKNAFPLTS